MTTPQEAVARLFGVDSDQSANFAADVYPGYPGLVIADGRAQAMTWGFPLVLKSKKTGQPLKPKPVNNAREDKLQTGFWRDSFAKRRCLIPVSSWAEAEGAKGSMTRTWFSLPDIELFAVAGLWRPTIEWGDAYSMVMVDGSSQMAGVHDRMPTILHKTDWQQWTGGTAQEALELCQAWEGPLQIQPTGEPWHKTQQLQPHTEQL